MPYNVILVQQGRKKKGIQGLGFSMRCLWMTLIVTVMDRWWVLLLLLLADSLKFLKRSFASSSFEHHCPRMILSESSLIRLTDAEPNWYGFLPLGDHVHDVAVAVAVVKRVERMMVLVVMMVVLDDDDYGVERMREM
jgi:hypothetical protein